MFKRATRPFKRVMATTLSVAMAATMCAPFTTLAAGEPENWDSATYPAGWCYVDVTADKDKANPGDTLNIKFDLHGDGTKQGSQLGMLTMYFYYNSSQLTYSTNAKTWLPGDVLAETDDTDLDGNAQTDMRIKCSMTAPDGLTPFELPTEAGTTALTLTFTVNSDASAGPIINGYADDDDFSDMANFALIQPISTNSVSTEIVVAPTGISLDNSTLSTTAGSSETLTATVEPSAATEDVTWSVSDPDVVSVTPVVTPKDPDNPDAGNLPIRQATLTGGNKAGTATVTATVGKTDESDGFSATCTVTNTVPLNGITVTPTTATVAAGKTTDLTVAYNPTTASEKPMVEWSTSDPDIATVTGKGENNTTGTVTGKGEGTAIITAKVTTSAGTEYTATSSVEVTTNPNTGIGLNKSSTTINKGNSEQLIATVTKESPDQEGTDSQEITWSSSAESVATVDENGVVTAVAPGTATITATIQSSDAAATGGQLSASCTVTVNSPLTDISLDKDEITFTPNNNTSELTVTFNPDDATQLTNVVWTIDNQATSNKVTITPVAGSSYNNQVTITAGSEYGDATITATETTEDGAIKTATCIVHNTNPLQSISLENNGTDVADQTITMQKNATTKLDVVYTAMDSAADTTDNKDVVWTVENSAVASVAEDGTVTSLQGGRTNVTATVGNLTASCEIFVNVPVENAAFNEATIEAASNMSVGQSMQMQITFTPFDASDIASITWASSDESIATVDANGVVTAKAPGIATITATIATLAGEEIAIEQDVTVHENTPDNPGGNNPVPAPGDQNGGATVTPSASSDGAGASSSTNNVKTGDAFPLAGVAALAAISAAGAVLIKRRKNKK